MAESMAAATDSIISGFFHLTTNKRRFDESKFSPLFTSILSSDIPCFDEWAKVEIFDSHFWFSLAAILISVFEANLGLELRKSWSGFRQK